jgi:HSP20 family molecular chaperone IbpA
MAEIAKTTETAVRPDGDGETQVAVHRTRECLRPPVDIWEDANQITLELDMPGVSSDRLSVRADRDTLVVEGDAQIDVPEGAEALYADVRQTWYQRRFALSRDLDPDKIEARLHDGVLTLQIPKREEVRPRKIDIRAD